MTNNRPTKTKVTEYFADVELAGGRWVRIYALPLSPPHAIYFLNERDIRRGFKVTFDPPVMFDEVAISKTLDLGETLSGWMFFEWPKELRTGNMGESAQRLRLTFKNSQNESAEAIIDLHSTKPDEAGRSWLGGGKFGRNWAEEEDLSQIPIRPFRE